MFIDENNNGILGDFGIAVQQTASFQNHTTPFYAPPEYSNSQSKQDKTWDIYALGKSVFEVFFEVGWDKTKSEMIQSIKTQMKAMDSNLKSHYKTIYKTGLIMMHEESQNRLPLKDGLEALKSLI